jgi:uncharacterized membrane protein
MSSGDSGEYTPSIQVAELLDLVAVLVAMGLLLLAFLDTGGVVRLLLALVFAFFVPGRAIVSNWPRMANWSDMGMSIALSLAVLVVFSTCSLWARFWHPLGLFQLEAVLSLIGLGVAIARRRRFSE